MGMSKEEFLVVFLNSKGGGRYKKQESAKTIMF